MARPIPTNPAGLQHEQQFHAQPYVPVWGVRPPAQPPMRQVAWQMQAMRPRGPASWRPTGLLLLAASGLAGGLAVLSSLEVWPPLAASRFRLDERGAYFLLVAGIYLLATTLYAAWRTRLLGDLHQAPWDARLMAYANLGVGGAIGAGLGVLALALAAIILILIWLLALLLSGSGGRPQG